jgi:hypothetical protein
LQEADMGDTGQLKLASSSPPIAPLYASARAVCGSLIVSTCAALLPGIDIANAGSCAGQIALVERQVSRASPGPASGPTVAQSVGAQLHHQPTPDSVQGAEAQAQANAEAALDRARKADAEGDTSACARALEDVKELYGLE